MCILDFSTIWNSDRIVQKRRSVSVAGLSDEELWAYRMSRLQSTDIADRSALLSECVGFNVPLDTYYVISGTIFTGQMTN